MLNVYIVLSLLISVFLVLLGMAVLLRNSKLALNRLFFLFNISLSAWLVSNYLAADLNVPQSVALTANKAVLAAGGASVIMVFLFIKQLTSEKIKVYEKILLGLAILSSVLALSPLVVDGVESDGITYLIEFGILSPLYFVSLLAIVLVAARSLIVGKRKHSGAIRSQIRVLQYSFITGLALIFITNAILPFAFGVFSLTNIGSLFSILFVFGISRAVVGHKLFDLRFVVARSLAYILLLATLIGLYGIIVFGATDAIFGETLFAERIVPILTALLLAFTSPYFRKLFDRLTNKLFYRDAYDSQEFLEQVNRLLVGQINLEELLQGITSVIEQNLKTSYCVFIIRETAYEKARIVGTDNHKFKDEKIKQLRETAPHAHRKVLIADELVEYKDQLEGLLKELDISVLIRLVSNASQDLEGMGYLVLGPKKNGTIYSAQDKQVLDILANEMVIAVENALRYEEIQKFADTLQEKVDDQTKSLRKANEKLKQMDETKDEFISMASHQLRTPLTSVKGYLSMVLEGDVGTIPEMQRKLLDQAFVSSQRMVYLIADLLNVSRLRTGKFIIEQVPTNLANVVEEESGQLVETAKARNLELTYSKPDSFPEIPLDETKIRQVVMNFMDNAIYYTPSGGHIKVEVKDTGKAIEYTVTDDGLGVPKWDQAHLFTKFYRAGNAKKARPDGTGLGLFMAKKVVAAQGGSIIFKSEEGKGSTFGFSFDKEKLQKMADEQAQKEEVTHPKPTDLEKAAKTAEK